MGDNEKIFPDPIHPDVNPLATYQWLGLKDEAMASPVESVVLARLEFIASQNAAILSQNAAILEISTKKSASRRSSVSSASLSSSNGDATEELDGEARELEQYYEQIAAGTLFDIIAKIHEPFVANKELYRRRCNAATADAVAFAEHVVDLLEGEEDVENGDYGVIVGIIDMLDADFKTKLYIALNKAKKDQEKATETST